MPDVTITITIATDDTARGRQQPQAPGAAPSLPAAPISRTVLAEGARVPASEAAPLPLEQLGAAAAPKQTTRARPADLTPPEGLAPQPGRSQPSAPAGTAAPEDIEPPPTPKAPPKSRSRSKTTK